MEARGRRGKKGSWDSAGRFLHCGGAACPLGLAWALPDGVLSSLGLKCASSLPSLVFFDAEQMSSLLFAFGGSSVSQLCGL